MEGEINRSDDPCSKFIDIFQEILDKHAPLNSKEVRGNQAPLMNKESSKVVRNKFRLKKRYLE